MSSVTPAREPRHAPQRRSLTVRCAEVIRLFGPFGFMAFGGTAANIVMLRKVVSSISHTYTKLMSGRSMTVADLRGAGEVGRR
jgi:hypothetical protein